MKTNPLYRNHQWMVTKDGLESVKPAPTYPINADRLWDKQDRGHGEMYDFPLQMAEKSWVDIDAFVEAFRSALEYHSSLLGKSIDTDLLNISCNAAFDR